MKLLTKETLITILKSIGIPVNEGISSDPNSKIFPRMVFWEFIWTPQIASGNEYNTIVTYQISLYARTPRNNAIIRLKKELAEYSLNPIINHEFIEDEKYFHSYLAVDVLEDINED